MQVLFLLLALVVEIDGISLSYIQDVVLKPIGTQYVNKTTTINGTCDECKCKIFGGNSSANNVALNCFPNNTCQLFPTVPPSYKLQSSITARLYFGANMPPSTSQCCMPNITELISRLQNTTPTVVSFSYALGAIGYDEARPDRAVAIGSGTGDLYWFNPWNMSFIQSQTINGRITIALYNGSMFTGIDNTPRVNVFNDQSLACVNNKTYPSFNRVRKFLFMNNSQTAMVTTQDNKSVTVLDMTSPTQFTIRGELSFPSGNTHGAAKVNDSFFYVSSWTGSSVGSYSYANATWNYKLLVSNTDPNGGSHIAVDECGRVWFLNPYFGLRIYDAGGAPLASWNMGGSASNWVYDILLLPNYVMMVTYWQGKKIMHYDPRLSCD